MPSFIETPFLAYEISAWAQGGRGWKTTVVETYGGDEFRNAAWSEARGEWDISEALRSTNSQSAYNWIALRNMHRLCRGMLNGFRFRDPLDYKDEGGGTWASLGGGAYQMTKTYTVSPLTEVQTIKKPEPVNAKSPGYLGIAVTGNTGGTLDYNTGILTGGSGTPTAWTGQYHVPVRFAEDLPRFGLDSTGAYFNWQSLRVIEIRNPGVGS
jgi:uncharacterized protein (TIGR02217 family)